jgi:hypothetical protein
MGDEINVISTNVVTCHEHTGPELPVDALVITFSDGSTEVRCPCKDACGRCPYEAD